MLMAQGSLQSDTININEVVIRGVKAAGNLQGYRISTIDSATLRMNSQNSLADLLSMHSSIFIKSYGMGGTATPSFRGTGASHTQLAWNDININSPMLGQSDLSLLPVGLIDAVQIYYGGASMPVSGGGLGGVINVTNTPVWNNETELTISPSAGSFGHLSGLVKVKTGSKVFQSVTRAFYQYGRNNFSYLNNVAGNEPVWEKRNNSQVSQRGLIQELYFRKNRYSGSARIWYQAADRNLPSSMLIRQPGMKENQADESLRTVLNLTHTGTALKLNMTGAWIADRIDYNNSLASIYSRNKSQKFVLKSSAEKILKNDIKLNVSVNEEVNLINSNNYGSFKSRNTLSFVTSAGKSVGTRFGANLLLRETFDRNSLLLPDFSAGLQYRVIAGEDFFMKANLSRNSRIPSMNDLFWLPGGNQKLRNEYALTSELGASLSHKLSDFLVLKSDLTYFRNNIRDMIQWHPGSYSYWTADNIKHVITSGLESSVRFNYSLERFSAGFTANYTYTVASTVSSQTGSDASIGKQLIYVPVNMVNSSVSAGYGRFYTSWEFTLTGKRYVTSDNTGSLPSYMLNNCVAGFRLSHRRDILDLKFQIDNLFNVDYQAIAWYPMPGRAYSVKLLIQFIK